MFDLVSLKEIRSVMDYGALARRLTGFEAPRIEVVAQPSTPPKNINTVRGAKIFIRNSFNLTTSSPNSRTTTPPVSPRNTHKVPVL